MKKITIFSFLLVISSMVFAQVIRPELPHAEVSSAYKDGTALKQIAHHDRALKAYGDTLWTNDFSNPADWVIYELSATTEDQNWEIWTGPGDPPLYGISPIVSTTAANGYALFNSDANGNAQQTYGDQDACIQIVAPLDFTNNDAVQIEFQQAYRKWQDSVYIEVSTDSTNWIPFGVNEVESGINAPDYLSTNITSAAANQATVWIRFRFIGGWDYAWMIDDIVIIEAPDNNLVLTGNVPYWYQNTGFVSIIPKYYIGWYRLAADITNVGNLDQTNPSLNVNIVNGLGNTVFDWTTDSIGSFGAGTHDTIWSDSVFMPDPILADYTATFTVSQNETDQIPEDNSYSLEFSAKDTIYAHDQGIQTSAISPSMYNDAVDGDGIGLSYYIPIDDTLSSVSVFIDNRSTVGTIFKASVFYYDDDLADRVFQIDADEHVIEQADLGNWVTVKLTSDDGIQQFAAGDRWYDVLIETYWSGDTLWLGNDKSNPGLHAYNFETCLRIGTTWYYTGHTPMVRLNMFRSVLECEPFYANLVETTDVVCAGDANGTATIGVAGGDQSYVYTWSNGGTDAVETDLAGGTYTVTVESCGEDTTITVVINEAATALSLTDSYTETSCSADGEIALTISGGETPYSILWSNGETTATISGLGFGVFDYSVTDVYGCELTGSYSFIAPEYPSISIDNVIHETATLDDGAINISVTGGVTPYSYTWTDEVGTTIATTEDITGLTGGEFFIEVLDANLCGSEDSVTVFAFVAGCDDYLVEIDAIDVSCFGGDNGSATAVVTNGTSPFVYSWSTGGTDVSITDLTIGEYYVIVEDSIGCINGDTVQIVEPTEISLSISNVNTCYDGATGEATVTVAGGTPAYAYHWSNGSTDSVATGLSAALYTITVTDGAGCTLTSSSTVGSFDEITIALVSAQGPNPLDSGAVDMTVSGGASPYTYLWDNGDTDEDLADVGIGTYILTVTDANGCTAVSDPIVLTGIGEVNNSKSISIYPSPTQGIINIDNAEHALITVYDILGNVVSQVKDASVVNKINLTKNAEGTYLVQVIAGDVISTTRILIVK